MFKISKTRERTNFQMLSNFLLSFSGLKIIWKVFSTFVDQAMCFNCVFDAYGH